MEFRLVDKSKVEILIGDRVVGHIFSPSANFDGEFSMQVCGFDKAHTLWGCGVFIGDDKVAKQDIQFVFSPDSHEGHHDLHEVGHSVCHVCYNPFEPYTNKDINRGVSIYKDGSAEPIGNLVKCKCDKLRLYNCKEIDSMHKAGSLRGKERL